ncbi:DUF6197 family protein [Streptomyces sp. NPDC055025]
MSADTSAVLKAAAEISAKNNYFWVGRSGELAAGPSVAIFLDAVAERLTLDGWARTYDTQDEVSTASLAVASDASIRSMLRQLIGFFVEEFGSRREPLTLWSAMSRTSAGRFGDTDLLAVGDRILDAIVQARTGSDRAQSGAWSERLGRTHDEITELLAAGAEFARTYGPSGVS